MDHDASNAIALPRGCEKDSATGGAVWALDLILTTVSSSTAGGGRWHTLIWHVGAHRMVCEEFSDSPPDPVEAFASAVRQFGAPATLVTDRAVISTDLMTLAAKLGVQLRSREPRPFQSSGVIERFFSRFAAGNHT